MVTYCFSYLYHPIYLAVCYFVLGKRMGCLDDQVPQDCQELIYSLNEMLSSIQRLTVGLPLYLVWPTKEWKHLKQTIKHLHELCLKHVEEKLQKIREENHGRALEGSEAPYKADFLTYILYSGKQSREEAATNAFDLMSAGIDQVSHIVRLFVRILITLQLSSTGFLPCRQPTPLPGVCTSWEGTQRSRRSCGVRFRGL